MSYILDALRRADAQRAGNPARGIHAQPSAVPTLQQPRRTKLLVSLAAATAVLSAGAGLWWMSGGASMTPARGPAPASQRAAPAGVAPPPATATVVVASAPPAVVVLPAPQSSVVQGPPAVATPPPLTTPGARPPAPRGGVREIPAPAAVAPAPPGPAATSTAATVGTAAVAPDAPTASSRIYTVAELPADVQQAFPKLSISGGVYSDNVAQRMLIVNGQVFNEGSEIAPGVVLEQVRARTVVLKFRGLRLSHPY